MEKSGLYLSSLPARRDALPRQDSDSQLTDSINSYFKNASEPTDRHWLFNALTNGANGR